MCTFHSVFLILLLSKINSFLANWEKTKNLIGLFSPNVPCIQNELWQGLNNRPFLTRTYGFDLVFLMMYGLIFNIFTKNCNDMNFTISTSFSHVFTNCVPFYGPSNIFTYVLFFSVLWATTFLRANLWATTFFDTTLWATTFFGLKKKFNPAPYVVLFMNTP